MPDQSTAARDDLSAMVGRFLADLGEFIDKLEREAGDAVPAVPADGPKADEAAATPDTAPPQKERRGRRRGPDAAA